MTITEAIKVAKEQCPDDYARQYLDVTPVAVESGGSRGLYSQLGYALNNMSRWRGPVAKEVKATIRSWRKLYEKENPC